MQCSMVLYLLIFHDKRNTVELAWGIMGVTARMAQTVRGLLSSPES